MSRFFSDKYSSLKPYVPGEQPKEMKYIKLNTNESPFPPSKKAIELATVEAAALNLYPDPTCEKLRLAAAAALNISSDKIIFTNGSDDILNFAFMAFCSPVAPAVFPDITYGFYPVFAALNNIKTIVVPLKSDFTIDIDGLKKAKGTIFLANPNAPTGIALTRSEIEGIVKADRNRLVVVDEAYVDFGAESCISLTDSYDNILVVQTFSKSRSMAGARLGYAVGCKELIADLETIRYSTNPYNINRMTMAAGIGALFDEKYFKDNISEIISTREYVVEELKKMGMNVLPSKANFVFASSSRLSGETIYKELKKRGVLVRYFSGERTSEYNRITIGSRKQMEIFIKVIKDILEEQK